MSGKQKTILFMLCIQAIGYCLNAQQDSIKAPLKNVVEFSFCYPTDFAGRVFKWDHEFEWTKPVYQSLGINYLRFIGRKRWAIEISYRKWAGGYTGSNIRTFHTAGEIIYKYSDYLSVSTHWPVIGKTKLRLFVTGDLTFRHGIEDIVFAHHTTSGGWAELIFGSMRQSDLGLSIGTRFTWFPHRRIAVSTDWRYSRFVLRYYQPDPRYSWDKGTSKNLLMAQFKVGFCF
jgi:hypothetical protein